MEVKLNRHWLHMPCDGTKAIEEHKPWIVFMTVIKEISQLNVQGARSVILANNTLVVVSALAAQNNLAMVVVPPNPQGTTSTRGNIEIQKTRQSWETQ